MSFTDWGIAKTFRFADERIKTMLRDIFAGKLDNLLVGDYPTNYFEVEDDGTFVMRGDSTVWDDLVGSLIANKLSSVAGGLQYDYDENAIVMNTAGVITNSDDRIMFSLQFPHAAKVDSKLHMHIHWEQTDAVDRQFTLQWRIQSNGAAKTTAWETVIVSTNASNAFTYPGSGTFNQITELKEVDMTDAGISATIQFRLARTDSVAGDILATFVDAHVERDTMGSRGEYVK